MAYAKSSAPGPDRTQHCKRTACCRSTGTLPLIFSVSGLLAPKLRRPRGRSKAEMQKEMKRRKKGKREEIKARRERRGNRKNEKRSVKENLESLALTDPSLQGRESTSEHIKVCAVERQSLPGERAHSHGAVLDINCVAGNGLDILEGLYGLYRETKTQ